MGMNEGLKDFYRRQRVCSRCGKIFRLPPQGRYINFIKKHGHKLYFCSESCKHKYQEEDEKQC